MKTQLVLTREVFFPWKLFSSRIIRILRVRFYMMWKYELLMTTNAHFKFKLDIFPPLSISPSMSSLFLIYLPRNSDLLVSLADLKTKKQKEKKNTFNNRCGISVGSSRMRLEDWYIFCSTMVTVLALEM